MDGLPRTVERVVQALNQINASALLLVALLVALFSMVAVILTIVFP